MPGLWAAANGIAGAIWYYIAPQLSTTYATNGAKSVLTIQAFVVFGLFFGLAQWLVLRRYRRVGLAWLLIAPFAGLAALIVGFSIGFVFFFAGPALFSGQGASTPNAAPDTAKPGVGGKAIGVVGSIGVFLSPHVSLAFEISLPERFDAMQELHYFFSAQYDNHHRDVILSGLFH